MPRQEDVHPVVPVTVKITKSKVTQPTKAIDKTDSTEMNEGDAARKFEKEDQAPKDKLSESIDTIPGSSGNSIYCKIPKVSPGAVFS